MGNGKILITDGLNEKGQAILSKNFTVEDHTGITADEMAKILNIPQNNESILNAIKYVYQRLNNGDEYNISTANALWVKEQLKLLDEFSDLIKEYYGGKQ